MKLILCLATALAFGACATPQAGPKPDVAPVRTANEKTRASIKQTHKSINDAQTDSKAGIDNLSTVDADLTKLLNP